MDLKSIAYILGLIEKYLVTLVSKLVTFIVAYQKKNQKESFKKAIEDAILKGDQRELDSGLPSDHSGVRVVKRDEDNKS